MDIINRVKQYAGRSMDDKRRPTNANITARETIEIADYIVELERRCKMLSRVKRVSRDSDMSVTVTFGSCAEASRFEEHLKDA